MNHRHFTKKIILSTLFVISPMMGCTTTDENSFEVQSKCEEQENGKAIYSYFQNNDIVIEICDGKCNETGTACDGTECKRGESTCTRKDGQYVMQKCGEDYNWGTSVVCEKGCDGDRCKGCLENETKCDVIDSVATEFTCENGDWSTSGTVCESGIGCNLDGTACGECQNNELKCEGSQLYKCSYGKWELDHACPYETSCNAEGTECGECKNDTQKCKDSEVSKCQGGAWQKIKVCTDGVSCNAGATDCGVCKNGDTRDGDIGKNIQNIICENGEWKVECISPYVWDGNQEKCVECVENKCLLLTSDNLDSQLPKRCDLYKEIALAFANKRNEKGMLVLKGTFDTWLNIEACKNAQTTQDCISALENFKCIDRSLSMEIVSTEGISIALACVSNQWKVDDACAQSYIVSDNTYSVELTQCSSTSASCEQ